MGSVTRCIARPLSAATIAIVCGAPASDDARLQNHANRIGVWLALHTPRPDLPWQFVVTDDDTVTAFATPAGYVIISRGMFMLMRSERELAGVLARELTHVVERHHLAAMVETERMDLALGVGKRSAGQDGLLVDAVVGAARNLSASGLDQGDESAADKLGAVIAERAGYDRCGLHHALMTLEAVESDAGLMGLFGPIHPPIGERLERLREPLSARPGAPGSALSSDMLAQLQESLRSARR